MPKATSRLMTTVSAFPRGRSHPKRIRRTAHSLGLQKLGGLPQWLVLSPSATRKMSSVVWWFQKWLRHDDAEAVTREDIVRWTDERVADGISPSTINKQDTPALRAIFEWGFDRKWIENNFSTGTIGSSVATEDTREVLHRR